MKNLVVVSNPQHWHFNVPGVEVISAKKYLTESRFSLERNIRVINLCRSLKYQSMGYYVSLLAQARGHKPLPNVQTIQDLKLVSIIKFVSAELDDLIQKSLQRIHSDKFTLSVYFGRNVAKTHDRLSLQLYQHFKAPLLIAQFTRINGKWQLQNISPLMPTDIPESHFDFVIEAAQTFLTKGIGYQKKKANLPYDLAILYTPEDPTCPSDKRAISKFMKAAEQAGFNTEIITKEDFSRLAEFDALFIRETTTVNHYTYRFARRAAAEGLVVIDDPDSIVKCTNKVYLAELMERHRIPIPKTLILHADNLDCVDSYLGYPCVLKHPDGSFSKGVVKVDSRKHLMEIVPGLLEKSDLFVAQEFIRTEFDWRIGILDQKPLFACKYFMARKHWQIYKRKEDGRVICGKYETIPISMVPKKILKTALKAANAIGNGLYGVDLKVGANNDCYIIEVNDNPSIEYDVEDQVAGDDLYFTIMNKMALLVERKKRNV